MLCRNRKLSKEPFLHYIHTLYTLYIYIIFYTILESRKMIQSDRDTKGFLDQQVDTQRCISQTRCIFQLCVQCVFKKSEETRQVEDKRRSAETKRLSIMYSR